MDTLLVHFYESFFNPYIAITSPFKTRSLHWNLQKSHIYHKFRTLSYVWELTFMSSFLYRFFPREVTDFQTLYFLSLSLTPPIFRFFSFSKFLLFHPHSLRRLPIVPRPWFLIDNSIFTPPVTQELFSTTDLITPVFLRTQVLSNHLLNLWCSFWCKKFLKQHSPCLFTPLSTLLNSPVPWKNF